MKRMNMDMCIEIWSTDYLNSPTFRNKQDKDAIIHRVEPGSKPGDYIVQFERIEQPKPSIGFRDNLKMQDPTIDEKEIDKIIERCKGAMNVSYFKYGEARKNFAEGRVDALGSLDNCLIKFNKTKNLEYLQDVINYALFRMMFPLPGDFYALTDSYGSAGVDGTPINME